MRINKGMAAAIARQIASMVFDHQIKKAEAESEELARKFYDKHVNAGVMATLDKLPEFMQGVFFKSGDREQCFWVIADAGHDSVSSTFITKPNEKLLCNAGGWTLGRFKAKDTEYYHLLTNCQMRKRTLENQRETFRQELDANAQATKTVEKLLLLWPDYKASILQCSEYTGGISKLGYVVPSTVEHVLAAVTKALPAPTPGAIPEVEAEVVIEDAPVKPKAKRTKITVAEVV